MPILDAEVYISPSDLLDRTADWATELDNPSTWSVFHTRPRQEKSVARELLHRGIDFYLPVVARRLLIRGRPVRSYVPLFPSYLFVRGTTDERRSALSTHRVAHVLPVVDPVCLEHDLQQVKQLIDSGAPLTVESRLLPGQKVRVRSGTLTGLEGTVCRRKNETRLIVWVHMLQQGVALEVDDVLLEPLS